MSELREKLAELEHQQWCHWTKYFLDNLMDEEDLKKNINKWAKQAITPYEDLSEKEKDSDREWADRVIKLLKK